MSLLLYLELEETVILQNLKKGDQSAFDTLFKTYYKYLVMIAYKYTGNQEASKDLVQEVYLDLWKRREVISIQQSIKFFLRKATINKCLARKRKTDRMVVNSEITETFGGSEDSTTQKVAYNDLNNIVQGLVDELPERCKEVFIASRHKNLSHKEISELLGISVKTIENQMTKALKHLRVNLKKIGLISFLGVFIFLDRGIPLFEILYNIIQL